MAGAVEITRKDMTPAQLHAAGRANDGRVARRILAYARRRKAKWEMSANNHGAIWTHLP